MIRDNVAKEREAKYICLPKDMHFLNVANLGTNKSGPNSLCALSVLLIDLVLFSRCFTIPTYTRPFQLAMIRETLYTQPSLES